MKFKSFRAFALVLAFVFILPNAAFAATYKDVPASHYAYTAVDWVSNPANGSLMIGDAANNFNPNRALDKFEAAKIFAVAAGYKYAASTISPAEQELFDRSYAEWKSLLDSQATLYSKWSKTADREIAYLLYKNILTVTDVNAFITKTGNTETVNPITKQEAIVNMIRLDGKQSAAEAIVLPYHTPFKDDGQIRADYKKYLYYAKEAGISQGSDGYINPTRAFTRGEMAQVFYNMFANRTVSTPPPTQQASTTLTGIIDYVYMPSHVYITADNKTNAYKLANNVVIMIDNAQKTAADLVKGMGVTALLSANQEIVSIVARTTPEATPSPTPAPVATPTPAPTPTPPPPITLSEDEGYVSAISVTPVETVTIKTQRVKLTGEIVAEDKSFTLAPTCTITRGAAAIPFNQVQPNDIVTFKYSGTVLHSMALEEKDRTITGTLVEKKYVDLSGTAVLVIEDANQARYELRVTPSTYFQRGNLSKNLSWNELRVGDEVEAKCEYDRLITVYAVGTRSTMDGRLQAITISENSNEITVLKSDGTTGNYIISSGTYDVYTLRVGMNLTLFLDSWEVYDISLKGNGNGITSNVAIQGYIHALRSGNTIEVAESNAADAKTYAVRINENTINAATGEKLDFNLLQINMYVYVALTDSQSYTAQSVRILP